MKQVGSVEVPQEAFIVLKMDDSPKNNGSRRSPRCGFFL